MIIYAFISIFGVIFLVWYMISSKSFPSIGEFMASSTPAIASSTMDILNALGSTTPITETSGNQMTDAYSTTTIHAPKADIYTEIADTERKMQLGLGERNSLAQSAGMIFISEPRIQEFWMKGMYFPIDIIWIDQGKRVTGIVRRFSPDTFPNTVSSGIPVPYVLELNAGAAERFGIATGTILKF